MRTLILFFAIFLVAAPVARAESVTEGHLDLGPTTDLTLNILDHESWKPADSIHMVLDDSAKETVPSTYSFIGADEAWVIPQVQKAGIPWLGWNTQYPDLEKHIDRGIYIELLTHEGAGDFTLFLNSGFGEPEVLMSTRSQHQPMWVDLGTHAHANWVFTAPGEHAISLKLSATTLDGQQISKTGTLYFSINSSTATKSQSMILPAAIIVVVLAIIALVLGIVIGRRRGR
ncbi:MAG: choice-of-anchor M domain-containing protein [Corynebacterium sp.]|nr:choice-of-anchor M domain-containing protein [Corynebacterium sp.]